MMQGMRKTTGCLSDQLKRDIARIARDEGRSEAEVIRTALGEAASRRDRPVLSE